MTDQNEDPGAQNSSDEAKRYVEWLMQIEKELHEMEKEIECDSDRFQAQISKAKNAAMSARLELDRFI